MRILSLGFPMPGPQVDNHSFASAPTFFDYDAIVVSPLALSQLIEEVVSSSEEHTTRSGERVVNAPTAPETVGLADLLRDRQDETARLLARDGLVVCFAYPNVVHHRVAGFGGCDRYFWLPAPPGLQYREPYLRRGSGSEVIPINHDHPFGPLVSQNRTKLAYHAYFSDGAPGFAGVARVLARSTGGAAVAVELQLARGRAVFLPPPARALASDARYAFSNLLQEGVRRMLELAATSNPPSWLASYELPGLDDRLAAREEKERQLAEAQEALSAEQDAVEDLDRYRRLLWQEGKYGLEQPVRDAFALLGFRVVPPDVDTPAELWLDTGDPRGRQVALLEVEGSVEAVGMEGHHRLRRRLEEAITQGRPKRGVLIINGHRRQAPAERPAQHEEALRVAAESMRYCVATTEQLFHAVRAALEDDEETVRVFNERLLTTEGVMSDD